MPAELDHPAFPQPTNPECRLWRYLSIPRFRYLVDSRGLYFARADLLGDPFEGSLPFANKELNRWLVDSGQFTEGCIEEWTMLREVAPRWTYVSCWHRSAHESTAMWAVYGAGGPAVAVVTRYATLAGLLPDETMIGQVTYIDYATETVPVWNALCPLTHKREAYRHEQEVRAARFLPPPGEPDDGVDISRIETPPGVTIDVDVESLIEKVVLSPDMPRRQQHDVQAILDGLNVAVPCERSGLEGEPTF